MDIIKFAEEKLGEIKLKGKEIHIKTCPYCGKSDWKFYLNAETGLWNCKHLNNCGERGGINKLLHKFGIKSTFKTTQKYKSTEKTLFVPEAEQKEFSNLKEDQLKWFESRGIKSDALKYAMVCNRSYKSNKVDAVCFPYFQENELKIMKYRDYGEKSIGKEKRVWQQAGGIPVLWGLDKIDLSEPFIICEGEMDYLSFIQAGITQVVSVPFGVDNFGWVEENWKWLEKAAAIYLCMDNDNAGLKAEEKMKATFGIEKVKKIELGSYKDVNEILIHEGEEAVNQLYYSAIDYNVQGIYNLCEITVEGEEQAYTSLKGIDRVIGGFREGEVTVWSGEPGSGKSTILNQVILEAIEQGGICAVYSGETTKSNFVKWITIQASGWSCCEKVWDRIRERHYYIPSAETLKEFSKAVHNKLFLLEDAGTMRKDILLDKMKILAKRNQANVFIVDNIMQMDLGSGNKNELQKEFMVELVNFAQKYNSHIHLVAHPKKPARGEEASMYDISGASEIPNLSYNIIRLKRINDDVKEKWSTELGGNFEGVAIIQKNRKWGEFKNIGLNFDINSKRYYTNEHEKNKKYKFDLIKKETIKEFIDFFEGVIV